MGYAETKVYFDGSHYIAIPHTERPSQKRPLKVEEIITVVQDEKEGSVENIESSASLEDEVLDSEEKEVLKEKVVKERHLTKKELFNELYQKYFLLSYVERKKKIVEEMQKYFKSIHKCIEFVEINLERKKRNLIYRRIRMSRKANLANFNYFCTFTYDDRLHNEDSFKKKLKEAFRNFCYRKNWKYMGVWERAPETDRLHFHGLFYIPNGCMPGVLEEHNDYSFATHKRQITIQNTYFNERFGRSDFEEINNEENKLGNALAYLMKYIEKTGERIVYSKGLLMVMRTNI